MRYVANKWTKLHLLKQHSGVMKHMPAMKLYSESALREMLSSYRFIVAKPLIGYGGKGVLKLVQLGSDQYEIYDQSERRVYSSWTAFIDKLKRVQRGRRYMLQQGIELATLNGRRVDFRVKLVKEAGRWKVTAVVARLPRPGLFVTNLSRGGSLVKGRTALRRMFPLQAASKAATMIGVARTCTFLLEQKYTGLSALGYDFGIDRAGSIWIFEVNTKPQ